MKCKECKEKLNKYIGKELSDLKDIKDHMDNCSSCLTEYKRILDAERLTLAIEEIKAPYNFYDLIQRLPSRPEIMFPISRWAIVAASVLVMITGIVFGFYSSNVPNDDPSISADMVMLENPQGLISSGVVYNVSRYYE